jgi:integrase
MPSLTKDSRNRSPYWTCCFTSATGQRLKKSTKITVKPLPGEMNEDGTPKTKADKRKEAMEFCVTLERTENSAKAGTLTEQAAKKYIGEILERTSGDKLHDYATGDWLDEWLTGKTQTKAAATGARYKQVKRDFIKSLGSRARLSLAHITPSDIRAYRDAELAAGKSPQTANISVGIVSAAFNAALRQAYIANNPCTALEPLPEQTAERSTFTPEQIGSLVAAAEGDWKGLILAGYFTGGRLRDLANLQWNAIDLKGHLLTFTAAKTGKPVAIPLHPDLERHLLASPGIGKAFLFPSLAGKGTGGENGLSGQFAAIMAKAGIVATITKHTKEGRANKNLSFHSLRHSFNSGMANAGVSQEVRQRLTGHASAEMNRVYTHHELEPLRAAIGTLPSLASK